ncbi:MAG TPA: hypothetical protein VNF00_01915 [Candidatus Acidoferrales bacterium]|nr:hypothetical protein [Candidatus Acidoferrales bacterium]
MVTNNSSDVSASRSGREIQLLQFVCDTAGDEPARGAVIRALANYAWLDADNEILFEAIHRLFARNPADILSELPAALTRCGFPDLPWEPLMQRSSLAPGEAVALAAELLRATK